MSKLTWDQTGEKVYETGVDHGVLYLPNVEGQYDSGVAWNGLTGVTESPSGAESNKQYADNQVYLNLVSAEEFNATIEAFTYPDEFEECDGSASPVDGLTFGQQTRRTFGLSYRTRVGNDTEGTDHGYKLHLVYGGLAAPSERSYATMNDSPEAMTLSWELSTTPVEVGTINGKEYKPTASLAIDSRKFSPAKMQELQDILYGTESADPRLPLPREVYEILNAGDASEVTPTAPSFDEETNTITIPTVTGVEYRINGEVVTGSVVIESDTLVIARALPGYKFPAVHDSDWVFTYQA